MLDTDFKTHLKAMYSKYVKLYHPDVNRSKVIEDSSGATLSPLQKDQRFLQVQLAYDILKDPRRRAAYNRYHTREWNEHVPRPSPHERPFSDNNFNRFQRANANRWLHEFSRNEKFWHARNWNDYYQMRYKRNAPTREEMNKNKVKILLVVLGIGGLVFVLEILAAFDASAARLEALAIEHQKSRENLDLSRANYGHGTSPASRVERFLVTRRLVMPDLTQPEYKPETELPLPPDTSRDLASYLDEDQLLMTEFARRRVSRWQQVREAEFKSSATDVEE